MRTYTLIFLLGLLPMVAGAQAPDVIARKGAFDHSEAIFNSGKAGEGGEGGNAGDAGKGVPQAQSKIASPQMQARDDGDIWSATTLAVLRANCPKGMAEAEWLKLMEQPANRTAFPLRVTQGMLDTLDGREMDLRFQYLFIPDQTQHHGPHVR